MAPRSEKTRTAWLRWDERWCGQSMLPVRFLLPFLADDGPAFRIILLRWITVAFTLVEIVGTFVLTLGLLPGISLAWLWMGGLLKVGGILGATATQNLSGGIWMLQLNVALRRMRTHGSELRVMLADRGLSEGEINAMQALPGEIYTTEVNSYSRLQLLMGGIPLACACGLLVAQEVLTGFMVALIGMTTAPLSESFYQKRVRVVDERIRLGRATGVDSYLAHGLQQNQRILVGVQAISQLPLLLFLVRYAYGLGGDILASYFGITQGLIGLTTALSFQRSRVSCQRASESARHLLEALASPALLVSQQSWALHRESLELDGADGLKQGVLLRQFAVCSSYPRRLPPLDAALPAGALTILQAPSGKGKTLLMLALAHLVDHTGDLFFVRGGVPINAHALPEEELSRAVWARREVDVERSTRIVDLFRPFCRNRLDPLYGAMRRNWGQTLTDVVWSAGDSRLERQLRNLPGALPLGMKRTIEELRSARLKLVNELLQREGLAISAEKSFGSLSSGEKRRILALVALTTAEVSPFVQLLILDEPFANLDAESIDAQIDVLERLRQLNRAILIISHTIPHDYAGAVLAPYAKGGS